ncbi:MAG: hypothetical protein K2O47_07275, partial [Muribaculaceae bacterium]|nr:hypothetical protein [Muribaculaceae bacterium]
MNHTKIKQTIFSFKLELYDSFRSAFSIAMLLCLLISCSSDLHSQIIRKVGEHLLPVKANVSVDTLHQADYHSLSPEDRIKVDSVKMLEMTLQIEEMKLNEILLRNKLDENNQLHVADSLKRARQIQKIDSLRAVTPGVPVVVDEDTLFRIYAPRGGHSPID